MHPRLAPALLAVAALAPSGAVAQTAAQIDRGTQAYADACAMCHGADMSGGAGVPALTGPEFTFGWKGKPTGDLLAWLKANMPPGNAGGLGDQQYLDIIAALLKANGAAPGAKDLTSDAAVLKAPLLP